MSCNLHHFTAPLPVAPYSKANKSTVDCIPSLLQQAK